MGFDTFEINLVELKKHIVQKLTGWSNNQGLDLFADSVGPFRPPGGHFWFRRGHSKDQDTISSEYDLRNEDRHKNDE